MCEYETVLCFDHKPVQHRDAKIATKFGRGQGRTTKDSRKKYICKHCKVQVISSSNLKAIWTQEHSQSCPRRKTHG